MIPNAIGSLFRYVALMVLALRPLLKRIPTMQQHFLPGENAIILLAREVLSLLAHALASLRKKHIRTHDALQRLLGAPLSALFPLLPLV